MKIIPLILFVSFLAVTMMPLTYIEAPVSQPACEDETVCCMAEEDMTCDKEDMECCPPGMCNPTQCVFYCFVCPVTNDRIEIKIYDTGIKIYSAAGQFMLSDFTTECWQPPKIA